MANSKYSRSFRISLVLALLIAAAGRSSAAEPSFNLEYSTWEATNIVLANATALNGTFQVVESWKGDLPPGQRIWLREMIPADDAIPVSFYSQEPSTSPVTEQIPKQTAGLRVILFLSNRKSTSESEKTRVLRQPLSPVHGIKTSVVWIDGAKLYCFKNRWGIGASDFEAYEMNEAAMKARVGQVNQVQEDLAKASQIEDAGRRAEQLRIYAGSEISLVRYRAFSELGRTGAAGVPVLRAMLDDPKYSKVRGEVMHSFVMAGGADIAAELGTRLREELDFWKATAPSLHEGWWNEDNREDGPLRAQYSETLEIVRGLQNRGASPEALNTVIELRDFWRSLPQLNDPSGLNQMAAECDAVIERHGLLENDVPEIAD